jgi:hypothetical protein
MKLSTEELIQAQQKKIMKLELAAMIEKHNLALMREAAKKGVNFEDFRSSRTPTVFI